jgi:hypothetical protein
MKTSLVRFILSAKFALIFLFFSVCGLAPLASAQNDCKIVFDASDKLTVTPHHGYSTTTRPANGGKPTDGEDISLNGTVYVLIRGKWIKSPMTVQDMQKQQQENRKNARNLSCHHTRDESVKGEAAAVYSAHADNDDIKSDTIVWISRSSGLILRQEEDIDTGDTKSHISVRYEYANVSAPAVTPME